MQFFAKDSDDNAVFIDSGDWALFKLLNRSELQKTDSTREYLASFKMGNYIAHYQLDLDSLVNPFIPDILSSFRCPLSLG